MVVMRMGFKPDNLPNKINENRVIIKGFQSTESKKEDDAKISEFYNFFVGNIKNPDGKNVINKRLKEMESQGLGVEQVMIDVESKFAKATINQLKETPDALFSDLSLVKNVINTLFNLGINKERFGKLLEPEIIPFFIEYAKKISYKNEQVPIDKSNPRVINGAKNLIELGINKNTIHEIVR